MNGHRPIRHSIGPGFAPDSFVALVIDAAARACTVASAPEMESRRGADDPRSARERLVGPIRPRLTGGARRGPVGAHPCAAGPARSAAATSTIRRAWCLAASRSSRRGGRFSAPTTADAP